MDTTRNRGLRRVAMALALLIGVSAAMLASSATAFADEEIVQEKVLSYPVVNIEGADQPNCTGTVTIAQTTGNSIQATNSVDCKREVITPLQIRSYVSISMKAPTVITSADDGCFSCRTYVVSTSLTGAAPGTRYCATGFANMGIGLTQGADTVCITT